MSQKVGILILVAVLSFWGSIIPRSTTIANAKNVAQVDETTIIREFPKGNEDQQVGISDVVPEREPFGPQAITVDENGRIYVLDSINKRIFSFTSGEDSIQSISITGMSMPGDLVVQNQEYYILDLQENKIQQVNAYGKMESSVPVTNSASIRDMVITSSGELIIHSNDLISPSIDLEDDRITIPQVEKHEFSSSATGLIYYQSIRRTDQTGEMMISSGDGSYSKKISIEVENYLGSASLLQIDRSGNIYVLVEEILKDVPAFIVDTTIQRYSPDGSSLTGVAKIPLDGNYALPKRFSAVSQEGVAYTLVVKQTLAQVLQLAFSPTYQTDLKIRGEEYQVTQSSQTTDVTTKNQLGTLANINRTQIIQNAISYLNVNWVLGAANYYKGPAANWDVCKEPDHWRLPRYLKDNKIGDTIAAVPYAWGGYQSIDEFRSRINNGNWAGNICAEAILGNVAGVDCSGYVSKILNLEHMNVNGLKTVAARINWNDLKPGDILTAVNGSHVVLFKEFSNGSDISSGINYLEANGTGYDQVIYRINQSYSSLNGTYEPRKPNNIIEDFSQLPAKQKLVINGDFGSNNMNGWWQWGNVDYAFYGNGVLYYKLQNNQGGGSVGQNFNYSVPAGAPMEMTLQLGNSSNVTKSPGVFIRPQYTWDGALACQFTIPPNTPLKNYILRGRVPTDWANFVIEFSPGPQDGIPDVMMDNIALQYRPDLSPNAIECISPDSTAPSGLVTAPANGKTITGTGIINFTADASDNAGGSGVNTVEFHVNYDGAWHQVGTDTTAPYRVLWTIPTDLSSQQLIFTIHVIDNAGNETMDPGGLHYVTYQAQTVPCPSSFTNWKGEYWSNASLSGTPTVCRDDPAVQFNWGLGSPHANIPADQFSARWTRTLNFQADTYRFHIEHDDGVRLYIDNQIVMDKWASCCGPDQVDVVVSGGNHEIRLEMNEISGAAQVQMWWEPVNITGWRGEYFNNETLTGNPVLVRGDLTINFDWAAESPHPLVNADHFSARWTRTVNFSAGTYEFTALRDDGARLWIDNVLYIDAWESGRQWETVRVPLTAGNHTLRYEVYEIDGWSAAILEWQFWQLVPVQKPLNLAAAPEDSAVLLTWENQETDSEIAVERSPNGSSPWTHIAKTSLNAVSYRDTNVECGQTYYYRVRALKTSLYSPYSNTASAGLENCLGTCKPARTLLLGKIHTSSTARTTTADSIDYYRGVPWDETGPEVAYTFYANSSGTVEFLLEGLLVDLDVFVLDDTGSGCDPNEVLAYGDLSASIDVQAGHTYHVIVDGFSGAAGAYKLRARALSFMPGHTETALSLRPTLAVPEIGARSYTLQLSRYADFHRLMVSKTLLRPAWTPGSNLLPATEYYWRVKVKMPDGSSQLMGPYQFTTPNPPGKSVLLLPASGAKNVSRQPFLQWAVPTLPLGNSFGFYELQIATDSSFHNPVRILYVDDFYHTYTQPSDALAPLTRYYWRVRAYTDASQFGPWSAVRNFKTGY